MEISGIAYAGYIDTAVALLRGELGKLVRQQAISVRAERALGLFGSTVLGLGVIHSSRLAYSVPIGYKWSVCWRR